MFCQKGQIIESENVCGKACHEPNLLVKAGLAVTSDQAAHGFIQSDVENLQVWRRCNFLWPTNPEQESAKLYTREGNN